MFSRVAKLSAAFAAAAALPGAIVDSVQKRDAGFLRFVIARPAAWVAAVWGRRVRPGNFLRYQIAISYFYTADPRGSSVTAITYLCD
jgi:hypothetical protein